MPRLFVAIDLPEHHKQRLTGLRDEALSARWTAPAQFHLTLRFIGEVDEQVARDTTHALGQVAVAAFSLAVQGLGVFPSMRKPRILFASLHPSPALLALYRQVEHVLAPIVPATDPKPFQPHVTLARLRRNDPRGVRAFIRAREPLSLDVFPVDHFYLYESLLRPEGALHLRRATYGLKVEG